MGPKVPSKIPSKPAPKPPADPVPKPASKTTPKPTTQITTKGKRERKSSSSPEEKEKPPKNKPPLRKLKDDDSDSDDDPTGDPASASTKPKKKLKSQKTGPEQATATAKIGLKTRRGQYGDGLRKSDINDGGARFVDKVKPLEVARKLKLTNMERFNLIVNRMNQTNLAGDDAEDPTSTDAGKTASTPSTTPSSVHPAHHTQKKIDKATTKAPSVVSTPAQAQPQPATKPKTRKAAPGVPESKSAAGQVTQSVLQQELVQQKAHNRAVGLTFILQQPVLDNRSYEARVASESKDIWGLFVRHKPANKYVDVMKIKVSKSVYQENECKTIVKKLARFCERWPFPISGQDIRFKESLLAAITLEEFPSKGFSLRGMRQSKERYRYTVNLIDPKTGKMQDEETSMAWDEFKTLVKPIPVVPKYVTATHDKMLGSTDTTAKKNATEFIKFVAFRFHGKILAKENFQHLLAALQKEYTGTEGVRVGTVKEQTSLSRKNKPKKPKSTKLYMFQRHSVSDTLALLASKYLCDTSGKSLLDIRLRSLSRGRIAFVTDAIDKAQAEDPADLLKAWEIGCKAADAMNEAVERGDPPPPQCSCQSKKESEKTQHKCLSCMKSVLCSTMRPDARGEPVCSNCAQKDERRSKKLQTSLGKRRLNLRVLRAITKEIGYWRSSSGKTAEETTPARTEMVAATFDKLCEPIVEEVMVPDVYAPTLKRSLTPQLHVGGRNDPFMASVEAAFPYGVFSDERRLHTPKNSIHAALYLNFMKNAFLPALLPLVAKWTNTDPATRDLAAFLEEMDDIYKCQRIVGFTRKQRLGPKFSRADYTRHLRMWKSAVPPTLSPAASKRLYKYTKFSNNDDPFKREEKQRICNLIRQIEAKFEVTMPRSKDGCPWPGVKETMPLKWSWGNCWALFIERQHREWDWCNRNFQQVDTTETLFLECIWQWCCPEYTEFLDLPLVVYYCHPLRFTIGKRVHGRAMRTGWLTLTPSSIDDRDDSMNNVLFEACISNWLKSNFLDSDCTKIRQEELTRISLSKEHFDPELRVAELRKKARREDVDDDEEDSFIIDDIDDIDDDHAGGADIDMDDLYHTGDEADEDNEDEDSAGDEEELEEDEDEAEAEAEAEPEENPVLTELEDDEQMAAVKDLEGDIHRLAREVVHQNRNNLAGSLSENELPRSAANATIEVKLVSMKNDGEAVDFLVHTVVKNRILQGLGVWAPED